MTADGMPHDHTDDHTGEHADDHTGEYPAEHTGEHTGEYAAAHAAEDLAGEPTGDAPPAENAAEDAAEDAVEDAVEEAAQQVDVLVADPPLPEAAAPIKGRIDIHNEVVEKVAGLAALEVPGVADLGGDVERTVESVRERIGIGRKRGDQGVSARIDAGDVTIDVTVVVEYGHVVMDVARNVQSNVAVQANRMLGLRVVEVNVVVDDVRLPDPPAPADETDA
jgi:uncharacterized alkaline shock family protein YloU